MDALYWLAANWSALLMAVAIIAVVIVALVRGEKQILIQILISLVTEAERQFGTGTGVLKKATVITWAYAQIPDRIKPFITEKRLTLWLEEALKTAKKIWERNQAVKDIVGK